MRISIVMGFFLPIPPVSGGATEKSWYHLARQFTAQGHQVTMISRRWRGFPHQETVDGIRHVRIAGFDHQRQLWRNLLLDFIWSWRVFWALPSADITVVNAVALPIWLARLKPRAGRIVLMTGRMPKGQYRHYSRIGLLLAASSYVRERVLAENPGLRAATQVWGYPIDWRLLAQPSEASPVGLPEHQPDEVTIGYVGRLHEEKGLRLITAAVTRLAQMPGLPPWRVLLCGPADVARGGSGAAFRSQLLRQLASALPAHRFNLLDPQFNDRNLAGIYRRITLFCYPSVAEKGETFGVAVAEAMATGAVPVVSNLACFTDFVTHEKNGLVFDHTASDAAEQLTQSLATLLRQPERRSTLSQQAQQDVQRYDYSQYASALLREFAQLTDSATSASSSPS